MALFTSLIDLHQALQAGSLSATELAQDCLRAVSTSRLQAFLHVDAELTLSQARAADARFASGTASVLCGIPIAHKDVFVTQGWRTTAASRMLKDYVSPFDATVVARLAAQGMVCLGKTNCDEFAMGSSTENSAFGPTHNPWDLKAVPGGSSGGSAAAVAAGLTPAATGTDTGGSVRQPAGFCGVTGIKPTYGRVSRYGMIAFASSLDQAGPFARSAADCAVLLDAMAGFDVQDATSLDPPAADCLAVLQRLPADPKRPLAGLRIGLPQEYFGAGVSADVAAAIQTALRTLEGLGAQLVEVALPHTDLSIPAYYVIAPAEASSNLARFDGVRYGHRASHYRDLNDMVAQSRTEGFGDEVKCRILLGSYVLSHGYYDAYYGQAQRVRRLIAQDFQAAFAHCDVLAGPVCPTVAWNLGEKCGDPVANYLADIFTLGASLAGLPGLSMPCGLGGEADNRPIGLQLIGNYFDEARLLQTAHHFQQHSDWHLRQPGGGAA